MSTLQTFLNLASSQEAEAVNVSALLDSIYAIDQALNETYDEQIKQDTLRTNIEHIEIQLSKEIYQQALTQDQKDGLEAAVQRGQAALTM